MTDQALGVLLRLQGISDFEIVHDLKRDYINGKTRILYNWRIVRNGLSHYGGTFSTDKKARLDLELSAQQQFKGHGFWKND